MGRRTCAATADQNREKDEALQFCWGARRFVPMISLGVHRTMIRILKFSAVLPLLLAGAVSHAGLTITGDESTFDAGLVAPLVVDFAGWADGGFTRAEIDAGIDFGAFTVRSGTPGRAYDGDMAVSGEALDLFVDDLVGTSTFVFEFDAPITAFGADFSRVGSSGLLLTANKETVTTADAFLGNGMDRAFAGVRSTTPFKTLTIGPGWDIFSLDDIRLQGAVPEPSALLALGVGAAALLRRRHRA